MTSPRASASLAGRAEALLNDDLAQRFLNLILLVLSVTVHEWAHAFTATQLGDRLPSSQGRVTLNPVAHVDPVGTLLLPFLMGFGWGRPVYTNPTAYTRRITLRGGMALVSFAGPFANLVMAVGCQALSLGLRSRGLVPWGTPAHVFLGAMFHLNLTLFVFNLLPFPPLDGSKIVSWLLGPRSDRALDALAGMGPMLLLALAFGGGTIISHATGTLARLIEGSLRLVFT